MSDEQPKRPLITPPPGLLPDPPRRDDVPEGTDSGTRRLARDAPVFFPGAPGRPPVAPESPAGTERVTVPETVTTTAAEATAAEATVSSAGLVEAPAAESPAPPTAETPLAEPASPGTEATPLAHWILRTAGGTEHPVDERGLVIGRNPSAPEGWGDAELLGVDDPLKTVSKTHAAVRTVDGALVVTDLASTNGVTLALPDGSDAVATPGVPTPAPPGATIGLGSFPLLVVRR